MASTLKGEDQSRPNVSNNGAIIRKVPFIWPFQYKDKSLSFASNLSSSTFSLASLLSIRSFSSSSSHPLLSDERTDKSDGAFGKMFSKGAGEGTSITKYMALHPRAP